jgi:hypothetical protein
MPAGLRLFMIALTFESAAHDAAGMFPIGYLIQGGGRHTQAVAEYVQFEN